jgi:hypothetical protein
MQETYRSEPGADNGGRASSRTRAIELTDRDVDVLEFIAAARLATAEEIRIACGPAFSRTTFPRRLRALHAAGFLEAPAARQPRRRPGSGPSPTAYAISRLGRQAIHGEWFAQRREAMKHREVLPVQHELLTSRLQATLLAACRAYEGGGRFKILEWHQGDAALARIETRMPDGRSQVEVVARPDVRLAILDQADDSEIWLNVEVDTGSMSHRRMRDKFERYGRWHRGGGPEQQIGTAGIRVAVVTTSTARRDNLRECARAVDDTAGGALGAFYWMMSLTDADDPVNFLAGRIWVHAGDTDLHTLLEE